jgi:hypothetical protein
MSNFKSQAKRKRELAKLDKRQAKDQKRALRKAERSGGSLVGVGASATTVSAVPGAASVRSPTRLAEAVERWKNTRIATPKKR